MLLLLYYIRHHDIKLINWILAVGTSILAASVTNSFCHVFTDYGTIFMRVINGLTVGAAVCIFVYALNLAIVKIAGYIAKRI